MSNLLFSRLRLAIATLAAMIGLSWGFKELTTPPKPHRGRAVALGAIAGGLVAIAVLFKNRK